MYLKWKEEIIKDFSDANINTMYAQGFVFTRAGRGVMNQTRSLRVDLSKFVLSSENRRVLKKTEDLKLKTAPIPYAEYHWSIGKLGKNFYETKFGDKVFSANKIKELLTNKEKSNFNALYVYDEVGYCIVCETSELIHYCYPFYSLQATSAKLPPNIGLGMMLKAILFAQEQNKKFVYLGSFQRPTDTYKLQFAGLEWFDGEKWQTDLEELKKAL